MYKYNLIGVQSKDVAKYWEQILPLIYDAIEYSDNTYSEPQILNELLNAEAQLWLIKKGAQIAAVVVTQLLYFDKNLRLIFKLCAGEDLKNWLHLLPDFFAFAQEKKCEGISVFGRRGWKKILKNSGFAEKAVLLTMKF